MILDTGPLVAFLNRNDSHHEWAKEQMGRLRPPALTCDAVIAEACHLLRFDPRGPQGVLEMASCGILDSTFRLGEHLAKISTLMYKYSNLPMSLADACLVRMTELETECSVLTLDSDFILYRRNGRQVIPLSMPRRV